MAKGKLSPRQKMINLMYLVFIAMLAMQIDQEIIRSYQDTNVTLADTREFTEKKNDKIFEQTLIAKAKNSPESFGTYLGLYREIEASSDDLVKTLEDYKSKLKIAGEFNSSSNAEDNFAPLNDTEPSTKLFFEGGDESKPSKESVELKNKVEALRLLVNNKLGNISEMKEVVNRANTKLVTEFPKGEKRNGKNWLNYKFYNQPLIAALSNLEVIQSDVRNIQSDAIVMMLQEKVDADIQFNAYEAIVAGPTAIQQGETATAKVLIGTYASTLPGLKIDNAQVVNGQGILNLGGALGEHTIGGNISFLGDKGKVVSMPYTFKYDVVSGKEAVAFESGALLSADKMMVLYRGVANPISGSILGADNSQTTLSAPGASVSKTGGGKWNVTPGSGSTIALTISGKGPNGKPISQKFDFRIKNVPPPQGQIRGENVLNMPASSIPNQTISAAIPEFDFPVTFTVTSFKFKVPGRAAMLVNGSSMSSVASMVKGLRSGDIVYVADIQATATGLGGQTLKKISPIVINVQ